MRIIVPFVLTADIPGTGSVQGINPEGIKTVSGIFQEYAERLLNECGFTKFGLCVLGAAGFMRERERERVIFLLSNGMHFD